MNRSYQVALLVVVVICAGIIVYAISGGAERGGPDDGEAIARSDGASTEQPPIEIVPEEPTADELRMSADRTASDRGTRSTDTAAPPPDSSESLIERIRRLQASDDATSELAGGSPEEPDADSDASNDQTADATTGASTDRTGDNLATEDDAAGEVTDGTATDESASGSEAADDSSAAAASDEAPATRTTTPSSPPRRPTASTGSTIASTEPVRDRTTDTTTTTEPEPTDDEPTDDLPADSATPSTTTGRGAPQVPRTYTIKSGDTFELIAEKLYGSKRYWDEIGKANPFVDPTRLKVGQVIKLPQPESIEDTEPVAGSRSDELAESGGPIRYRVSAGDSLWSIAKQYYGDGSKWRRIGEANRDKLGEDFDQLRVGDELIIPPPAAQP